MTDISNVRYSLSVPTSRGNITIPQLGGELSITGYDSKVGNKPQDLASSTKLRL